MTLSLETTERCPRTPAVRLLLEELGLPYRLEPVTDGHFVERFGTIGPMLRDGELEVLGLDPILRHLARSHGLFPADPRERAELDRWLTFSLTVVGPAVRQLVEQKDPSPLSCALTILDRALAEREYLLGRFTIADVPSVSLPRLRTHFPFDELPHLSAYAERIAARPAFSRATSPEPTPTESPVDRAMRLFSGHVGDGELRNGALARTTLPDPGHAPVAVLRPKARADVVSIVKIASEHGLPIHAVSCGKNWGFGDACPPNPGQLLLDLSALDRIIEIDEELGVAVVEPGVTQGRLAARLQELGSAWRLDVAGAGPDASIVGNALERGLGFGAPGERWSSVASLEVVLAEGEVLRTGFSGIPSATRTARVHRHGLGPSLDGLFSQSSLGVVTELSLWLSRRPERSESVFFAFEDHRLEQVIDALRPLRLQGLLTGNIHVFALPSAKGHPLWLAIGALEGLASTMAAQRREVESALSELGRLVISEAPDAATLPAHLGLLDDPLMAAMVQSVHPLMQGVPVAVPPLALFMMLGGPDVQKQDVSAIVSADPAEQGYGLCFSWQAVAAIGSEVRKLVDLVVSRLSAHGLPASLTVQLHNPRAATVVTRICFDPNDPAGARAARRELAQAALEAGFPPARLGNGAPALDSSWTRRLARALDPRGTFGLGRYGSAES